MKIKNLGLFLFMKLAGLGLAGSLSAFAQPFLYVSGIGNTVQVINGADNTFNATIPVSGSPGGLAISPDGAYVYVTLQTANSVAILSTATKAQVGTIPVGTGPVQIAFTPNGSAAYVVNQRSNSVSVINTVTRSVMATVPVGTQPLGVAVTPDGSRVFVLSASAQQISILSTATNQVIGTWPVNTGTCFVYFSSDGTYAYVANQYNNAVAVYQAGTGKLLAVITGFLHPNSMALSPDGSKLYVTNGNSKSLAVVSTSSRKIIATIGVGSMPTSVTLSPDGSAAYVTNMQDNTLSVVSTGGNTVVKTFTNMGPYPFSAAFSTYGPGTNPNLPTLPKSTVSAVYPTVTGQSIPVHVGGSFQTAVSVANCGDEIVLDPGVAYSGNFTMPAKSCSGQILIRSASINQLPAGQRVSPSSVAFMPTLVSPNSAPVLQFAPGASGYFFAGIEITVKNGVTGSWNLVLLSANATSVSQLPANIVFDRVYAHGNDQYCVRGFLADALGFGLINSYVSGFTHTSYDTQTVLAFNSPGPFLISNNYLEATGENIMLGGGNACTLSGSTWNCTPRITGVIPSDATITRNWFNKLYSAWNNQPSTGGKYDVKNHFEVKNGQRILLDSNVFSYAWLQGQGVNSIVLTPRTGCASSGVLQSGTQPGPANCPDPQAVANDITITNNQFQHVGGQLYGFGVDNYGYPYVTTTSYRVLFRNNLGTDVSAAYGGGGAVGLGNTQDWTVDHNTSINNPYKPCGWQPTSECATNALFFGDVYPPSCPSFSTPGCTWVYGPAGNPGATITNNLFYGNIGANSDNPLMVMSQLPPSANVSYDVWVGDITTGYPSSAHFWSPVSQSAPVAGAPACSAPYAPAACYGPNWALVGFVDFNGGNYTLSTTSPYHNAASDGTDIGANIPVVLAATAGVAQ
ncbi:MAG: YncE family protein [Bryobacteraceae bacterium]